MLRYEAKHRAWYAASAGSFQPKTVKRQGQAFKGRRVNGQRSCDSSKQSSYSPDERHWLHKSPVDRQDVGSASVGLSN